MVCKKHIILSKDTNAEKKTASAKYNSYLHSKRKQVLMKYVVRTHARAGHFLVILNNNAKKNRQNHRSN